MKHERFPPSLMFICFVAIVIGAIGVRLYKINSPIADWHSWRQADTATVSYLYVQDGIDFLTPRYFDISTVQTGYPNMNGWRYVEFPFFNALHALLYTKVGHFTFDTWGRLTSVIASVITTITLFALGRKAIGRFGGLYAAFVYAFLPFNVYFTRVVLPEPLGVTFSMLGLLFGVMYFEKLKMRNIFLSSIFFACALLMKPFFLLYALPLVYLALTRFGILGTLRKKHLLLALDVILIPFFAWRGYMSYETRFVGIPHFSWAFNGDNIRFRPSFWNWIFAERIAKLILGMWGIVPLSVGFLYSVKKYPVVFFSAVGMLIYLFLVATANVRHDYYQTMIIPALALCIAVGIEWFANKSPFSRVASSIFVVFCTGMMLLVGWYQIRDDYQVNHPEIISAGEAVQRVTAKDAKIIAPYNGDTAFLYQTKRFGWPVVDRAIEDMVTLGAQYYVSVNYDTDTNNFMKKYKTVEKTDQYIILDLQSPL